MKYLNCILTFIILTIFTDCYNPRNNPYDSSPLKDRFIIDGKINFSDLTGINRKEIWFFDVEDLENVSPVKKTTVRWTVRNDSEHIYFAIEWTDDTFNSDSYPIDEDNLFDGVQILIDSNGNGQFEPGEDKRGVIPYSNSSFYYDGHVPYETNGPDGDIIQNGEASLKYYDEDEKYQVELLVPIYSDENNEDANFSNINKINIFFIDEATIDENKKFISGNLAFFVDYNDDDSSEWPGLPLPEKN